MAPMRILLSVLSIIYDALRRLNRRFTRHRCALSIEYTIKSTSTYLTTIHFFFFFFSPSFRGIEGAIVMVKRER